MIRFSGLLLLLFGLNGHTPSKKMSEEALVETIIAYESFEGTVDELGYTSNDFSDGFSDYASRVNQVNAGSGTGKTYHIQSGYPANIHDDGTGEQYFYAVDDLDDSGNPRTDDLAIITFNNVDVSSATDLKFKLLLGTDRVNRFESDDYFQIYYAFDSDITSHPDQNTAFTQGDYTLLADFRGGSGSNTNASQDADFNGVGDGTVVLPTGTSTVAGGNNDLIMSDLSFDIAGTGNSLSIRIVMQTDFGDETFIFDYIRITGEVASSAPTTATVAATAFLEGAWDGASAMSTLLKSGGLMSLNAPYDTINNHNGSESVNNDSDIPADVVDWVLVELREADAPGDANDATRVGSAAGFLKSNGQIVATDGSSDLTISLSGNTGAQFFIVVYHRNHLPIMSLAKVSEVGGKYTIDLSASGNVYEAGDAVTTLSPSSKVGMHAGDTNGNGTIGSTDLSTWRSNNGAVYNYAGSGIADFNLDGVINAIDRNDFHQKNTSKTRQVPTT